MPIDRQALADAHRSLQELLADQEAGRPLGPRAIDDACQRPCTLLVGMGRSSALWAALLGESTAASPGAVDLDVGQADSAP